MRTPGGSMFPVADETVDVTTLRLRERDPSHDPACLSGIAVLDRRLEPLAACSGSSN
jgi:hypothetical protein